MNSPSNSPSLAELQQALQQYLLNQDNTINALTIESEKFSKQQRLDIYYDAYRLRLIDALRNDYPALELLLGTDEFKAVITEYIQQHPSTHPSLRWMGKDVSTFLKNHSTWQGHCHVAELAAFEWAQIMVFDAEDSTTAMLDNLRTLENSQWLTLGLRFHPSVKILSYYSNAPQLWNALINTKDNPEINTSPDAQDWLMWRHDLQVMYRPIDTAEKWSLESFLLGKNFSEICAGLCEWHPEDQVPLKAAQYLQLWIQNGLVSEIT